MPSRACFLALMLALAVPCAAAETDPQAPAHRPRVGLVLSGGGARGAAHVGVLKALESQHIPVDVIVGTSMGAVVGGLYASGLSAHEVESIVDSLDWQDAMRDRPSRTALNFRRKEDDRAFLVKFPLGISHGEFRVPKGLIQGQKLSAKLRQATLPVADITNFDDLPVPFRAVATDLATGEAVVIDHGSLATAVRASLSAPAVFAPVPMDGRVLVDGGLSENLPVEIARAMGVDVVIAVDVSSPLDSVQRLDSPLAVSNQMFAILINRATEAARASLTPNDILVTPDLGVMSSLDFRSVRGAILAGEVATQALAARLRPLAADEAEFSRFLARRAERPPAPRIDFVRVDASSGRYHKLIEAELSSIIGKPADGRNIDEALQSLYGRDIFEAVDYQVVDASGRTGLEVSARPKSWGPTYLHFDLELQDDFQGNDSYSAGVRFLITDVNPYLAEWRIDLKIGDQPLARAEFFEPLGYASPWFAAPIVQTGSRNVYAFDDKSDTIASYRVRETEYGLDFGRELGSWGEARVGVRKIYGSSSLRIGTPTATTAPPPGSFNQGGYYARFSVDRLDNVNFPRHGELATLEWDAQRTAFGADKNGELARADWLIARSLGRNTLIFWTSAGTAVTAPQGVQSDFQLGGFLNLSGLAQNSIAGPHFGIVRLIYMRKVGGGGEGFLDLPVYFGVSAEAGNVWQQRGEMSFDNARKDGSLFVGLDTPLGPLYLGSGFEQGGHSTYYLFLGHTF